MAGRYFPTKLHNPARLLPDQSYPRFAPTCR